MKEISIAIGSTNPVKIEATKNVMKKIYKKVKIIPTRANSHVPHTPLSEKDCLKGAINRAKQAIKITKADFGIGMEGGITKEFGKYFLHGWCAVIDKDGKIGLGKSGELELPFHVVKKVIEGKELGDVIDEITGIHNTKKKIGAVGVFTKGLINRQKSWEQALIYAMTKWLKPKLYG
jgi:inosine/xanthosine triphosphatase